MHMASWAEEGKPGSAEIIVGQGTGGGLSKKKRNPKKQKEVHYKNGNLCKTIAKRGRRTKRVARRCELQSYRVH